MIALIDQRITREDDELFVQEIEIYVGKRNVLSEEVNDRAHYLPRDLRKFGNSLKTQEEKMDAVGEAVEASQGLQRKSSWKIFRSWDSKCESRR